MFSVLMLNFFAMASMRSPPALEYRPGAPPVGPNAFWMASSTVLPGPIGFSLLARQMVPASRASSVGSKAFRNPPSRPRAPIQEAAATPAAPMPSASLNWRRVSMAFSSNSGGLRPRGLPYALTRGAPCAPLLKLPGGFAPADPPTRSLAGPHVPRSVRAHRASLQSAADFTGIRDRGHRVQHVTEYLRRLLHLGHRADRDSAVRVLERREVATDHYALLGARVTELLRRTTDVHEDEVRLRIGRLGAEVGEGLDRERPDLGVSRALVGDVLRVIGRGDGRGDAEDADVQRHLEAREGLDGVGLADRIADAHPRHAVRLRERPGDEHVGRRHREGHRGLVGGIRDVVVVRLIDQDYRVRRNPPDALDEVGDDLGAEDGRGRVVRVVEIDEPGAPHSRDEIFDVEPEARVDLDLGHRELHLAREARAVLERRRDSQQSPIGRDERTHRVLEDFLRARTEHDVLGLDLVLRRERGDEVRVLRRAVERIPVGLRELADDRVENHFAGTERILVAVDAYLFHTGGELGPLPAAAAAGTGSGARAGAGLHRILSPRGGQMGLETARRQGRTHRGWPADRAKRIEKPAAGDRHVRPPVELNWGILHEKQGGRRPPGLHFLT